MTNPYSNSVPGSNGNKEKFPLKFQSIADWIGLNNRIKKILIAIVIATSINVLAACIGVFTGEARYNDFERKIDRMDSVIINNQYERYDIKENLFKVQSRQYDLQQRLESIDNKLERIAGALDARK